MIYTIRGALHLGGGDETAVSYLQAGASTEDDAYEQATYLFEQLWADWIEVEDTGIGMLIVEAVEFVGIEGTQQIALLARLGRPQETAPQLPVE